MAFAQFYLFRHLLAVRLEVNSTEFWFTMQLAMIAGFATSYLADWWLVSRGIKEKMRARTAANRRDSPSRVP